MTVLSALMDAVYGIFWLVPLFKNDKAERSASVKSVRSAFLIGSENEMVMFCVLAMVVVGKSAVIRGGPALVGGVSDTVNAAVSATVPLLLPSTS